MASADPDFITGVDMLVIKIQFTVFTDFPDHKASSDFAAGIVGIKVRSGLMIMENRASVDFAVFRVFPGDEGCRIVGKAGDLSPDCLLSAPQDNPVCIKAYQLIDALTAQQHRSNLNDE